MTDKVPYSIPCDDTVDRAIQLMRDGLTKAITEARDALKEFPDGSILSARSRRQGEATEQSGHPKGLMESLLDSFPQVLEERLYSAMDGIFDPYPGVPGKTEVFAGQDNDIRALRKIRTTVYPKLLLLAETIGAAQKSAGANVVTEGVTATRRPTPETVEDIIADILKNAVTETESQ